MAETSTVKIPKSLRERFAAVANKKKMTQPALIEEMVSRLEDELFWASFGDLDAAKYQAAMRADGDLPGEDYSLENEPIAAEEAGATW